MRHATVLLGVRIVLGDHKSAPETIRGTSFRQFTIQLRSWSQVAILRGAGCTGQSCHLTLCFESILRAQVTPLNSANVALLVGCSTDGVCDCVLFLCSDMGDRAASASAFQPYSCDASTAAGTPMQHEGEDESSHNDTVSLLFATAFHTHTTCHKHVGHICTVSLGLNAASPCCMAAASDACKMHNQRSLTVSVLHWHQYQQRGNHAVQTKVAAAVEAGLLKPLTSSPLPTPMPSESQTSST